MTEAMELNVTGGVVIVDVADIPLLEGRSWHIQKGKNFGPYVAGTVNARTSYMHRYLLGLAHGDPREGDHRNGNGLDNRRLNLRIATRGQNAQNRKQRVTKHGFSGVVERRGKKSPYNARISVNGHRRNLGHFGTPEEAHRAYLKARIELFGDFCREGS